MLINSPDNKYFKLYKSLLSKKGITKNQLCLVSGRKIIPELITKTESVQQVVTSPKNIDLAKDLNFKDSQILLLKQELFNELDIQNTKFPLLIYKAPAISDYDLSLEPSGLEVLCSLGDPSNLGALLRSCEAFGVSKVILLKNATHPFLPKAIKASSGSAFKIPLFEGPFIDELKTKSFYALDKKGESIFDFKWPSNLRILMGEEGPGNPSHKPIKNLSVPMNESIESLNATVATSIVLSRYFQSLKK